MSDSDDDYTVSGVDEYNSDEYDSDYAFEELIDSDSPQDENIDELGGTDEFSDIKSNVAESLSAFKLAFTCLSVDDLDSRQQRLINQVVSLTGIVDYKAAVLLRKFKWHDDSLIERLMDDPEGVCDKYGVVYGENGENGENGDLSKPNFLATPPRDFTCLICYETPEANPQLKFAHAGCGHKFCVACYRRYIDMKVTEEGESASMTCPATKCNIALAEPLVRDICDAETLKKYRQQILGDYVASNDILSWCPAPNCSYAIECDWKGLDLQLCAPIVVCKCGKEFCIACSYDNHQPCTCLIAKLWMKKCHDDSETANWIAANTKDCPKCSSSIEKSGGCNHMICKKCRYEFCWLCMDRWAPHGDSYYNCSRYKADDEPTKEQATGKVEARKHLERYLHYYNRYVNHTESLKLDHQTFLKVQDKMSAMQQEAGMSWIEVQFLNQAYEALRASRQTLAWSYAFVYYLKSNNLSSLFEDMQQDLEFNVENLSALFEKPAAIVAKSKIELQDRRSYVVNRRMILLNTAIKGIIDGTYDFSDQVKSENEKLLRGVPNPN